MTDVVREIRQLATDLERFLDDGCSAREQDRYDAKNQTATLRDIAMHLNNCFEASKTDVAEAEKAIASLEQENARLKAEVSKLQEQIDGLS